MSALNGGGHAVDLVALDALIRRGGKGANGKAVLRDADHIVSKAGGALRGEAEVSDEASLGAGSGGHAAERALLKGGMESVVVGDERLEILFVVAANLTISKGNSEEGKESKKNVAELHFYL